MGPFKAFRLWLLIKAVLGHFKKFLESKEDQHGVILGQIRHAIGALGAFLVAQGYIQQEWVDALLSSLPVIAMMIWSFMAKPKG